MATIDDIADYIILRIRRSGGTLNQLKLQKLLYYVQAWHWANHGKPIVPARFEAWVHGPVNVHVYNRFRDSKLLYSEMTTEDIRQVFSSETSLDKAQRTFVDDVLAEYGSLSSYQLEEMTHNEEPWKAARGSIGPDARCTTQIDEKIMEHYYKQRIN